MLFREVIAVCSEIHTSHINTVCGQNVKLLNVKLAVCKDSVRTAQQTHSASVIKTSQLMLFREVIAVCSEINTKHINTVCWQNVELLNIKLAVYKDPVHTAQ